VWSESLRQEQMRSHRSGKLGELFCAEHFGIYEPKYEIKASGHKGHSFTAQAYQLIANLDTDKQYVIVNYHRDSHTIKRGTRKGRQVWDDTIEVAFTKKVDVYVVRTHVLVRKCVDEKKYMYCVGRNRNVLAFGKWSVCFRFLINGLPVEQLADNDVYTLWGDHNDPPGWLMGDCAKSIPGGLFTQPDQGPAPQTSDDSVEEAADDVPF